MKINPNKKYILIFLVCFFVTLVSNAFALAVQSEIVKIDADEKNIAVSVTKKYPEIIFTQQPNAILIEFLDSKYNKQFSFKDRDKNSIITKLDFLKDLSVKAMEYEKGKHKVSLELKLRPGVSLAPKTISARNNIVKISFIVPENITMNIFAGPVATPEIIESSEVKITKLYNNAVDAHSMGELDNAEKIYKEIISSSGGLYAARINLAQVYSEKKMYDQSVSQLFLVLDDLQKLPQETVDKKLLVNIHNALGTAYYLSESYTAAQKQFFEVLKLDPDFSQAYYNIGLIYEKVKDLKEAKVDFEKAIHLKSDFAEAYYHLALINLLTNNKSDAIKGFKKVQELLPGSILASLSKKELEKIDKK